jgi:hypothetical protein
MVQKGHNMSRLYNPFMPSLSFSSGVFRDNDGGGDGGGGDGGGGGNNNSSPAVNNYDNIYDAIDAEGVGATVTINGKEMAAVAADGYNGTSGSGGTNPGPSISQTEQANPSGTSSSDTGGYDEVPSISLNSYNTGGYDEIPSLPAPGTGSMDAAAATPYVPPVVDKPAPGTGSMDAAASTPYVAPTPSISFGEEAAKAVKYTDNETSALDQVAEDNFNASFDDDKQLVPGSVVDNIANAAATGNTNTDMLGNSAATLAETNDFNEIIGNQNSGNDNTNELTEAQLANAQDEDELDNISKILIETHGWTLSPDGTTAVSPAGKGADGKIYSTDQAQTEANKNLLGSENEGSTYDDGPIEEMNNNAENAGSTYDDGYIPGAGEGERPDGIDKILIETHGWTMGPNGDAIKPGSETNEPDPEEVDPVVEPDVIADPVIVNDDDADPVVVADDDDLPPRPILETDPGEPVVDPDIVDPDIVDPEEVDPVVDPVVEGTPVNPENPGDTFADQNDDGTITSLEATIANLRQQLSLLTNSSTQDTDGLTREEILALIAEAMRNNNSNSYNPLAYMNAFGFSAQPSYFGNTIPTFMSQDGVYERKAVKDRDTGEIRYVNVPIGNASLTGTGGFQRRRREGFGGSFDTF